jgi:hemoglobin
MVQERAQNGEERGEERGEEEPANVTVYEFVGGTAFFVALVDEFYAGIEADPLLRPLYPNDLTGPKARMWGFLQQYWGGPTDYSDERGHPRLRARHLPFVIGQAERDAWLKHMASAVMTLDPPEPAKSMMLQYANQASLAMINAER